MVIYPLTKPAMEPSQLPPPTAVFRIGSLCPKCFGVPKVRLKTELVEYLHCLECGYDWTHENPLLYHRPPRKLKEPRA